jgi:hypothetical protein
MRLITAHRILIGVAIAFFILYAVLMTRQYMANGGAAYLVQAAIGLAVAGGLRAYYRSLARWGEKR